MNKINLSILVLIGFVFLLSGCSLKEIDKKLGDAINEFNENKGDELVNVMDKENKSEAKFNPEPINSGELDSNKKEIINKWLEDNGFNRYGDKLNTMYDGGTPLFNEVTGESIDRFDYILEKRPEILELFK